MKFSSIIKKSAVALAFAGLATLSGGQHADAATATATLVVDATVLSACQIATTPVNFGTYDALGVNATAPLNSNTGRVHVTCANGLPWVVDLDEGANPAGGSSPAAPARQMTGTNFGDVLAYDLYSDAGLTTVWGAPGQGANGTGAQQDLIVYGQVPAAQSPQGDTYADAVTATVNF